jgi:hypothetical protein
MWGTGRVRFRSLFLLRLVCSASEGSQGSQGSEGSDARDDGETSRPLQAQGRFQLGGTGGDRAAELLLDRPQANNAISA